MPHFTHDEYAARIARTRKVMKKQGLDAMLLFAPESHYWLTGYDTFGFCFFQCMVLPIKGEPVLLTRSADLRQAEFTSILNEVHIWEDREGANGADDLRGLLKDMGLFAGKRLGVELDTQGLTAKNWRMVKGALVKGRKKCPELVDASGLISDLRLIKSDAEVACVRKAAELSDLALDAAIAMAGPGIGEGAILAAMQGEIFSRGGDYAGNEFIIGSGEGALLCRYYSGRRTLESDDHDEYADCW